MKDIPRPLLSGALWELSQDQSVLLYGSPGTGKSWLIAQFLDQCERESRKVVPLIAEDYQVATATELYIALGFSQPLPLLMASFGIGSVLVIDGLDALRAEASQKVFRELIAEVLREAPGTSVVVSIRTYDLQESREFRSLLRPSLSSDARGLTKLAVEDLSDQELSIAGESNPILKALLFGASHSLRDLLRNPFNLNIAMGLVREGVSTGEISELTSQVQLLGRYWHHRVESGPLGPPRQLVLRNAVSAMVALKSLSLPQSDVLVAGGEDALRNLFSQEVLRKSVTNRVAFDHNILFDYAVARLLLDEAEFFAFIKDDPSRTLFFRPSLTMFFHHLWANDRKLFWKVSRQCAADDDLPERAKVISSSVVCDAAQSSSDLTELLLDRPAAADFMFLARVLRAALALAVFQSRRRAIWLEFMDRLTRDMQVEVVNEVLSILATIRASALAADRTFLNKTSRSVVEWSISAGNGLPDDRASELSNVVVGRLLESITDTYGEAPLQTSSLIRTILDRLGSKRAGPNEAFRISQSMPSIIEHDTDLAKDIYIQMYSYVELSKEQTTMGGGPATTFFLSKRKQDYETALYSLMTKFRLFLDRAPLKALEASLVAVEREVEREHIKQDESGYNVTRIFVGQRGSIRYRTDFSEVWDASLSNERTSLTLVGSSFEHLSIVDEHLRGQMVSLVFKMSSVGITWKRLIETASRYPQALYELVKPLLFASRFISAPEVTVACGELFKQSYEREIVSAGDSEAIERAVLLIPKSHFIRRYERATTIQKRLISCIPTDRITNAILKQKKIRWESLGLKENRPFHRMSFGAYTPHPDEVWHREGIDPHSGANAPVLEIKDRLAKFESSFLNTSATAEECDHIGTDLSTLRALIKQGAADAQVLENARGTLIAAAKIVAKTEWLDPDSSLVQEARSIAIEGSSDPSPEFDPKYHTSFDSLGWGAPVARIEAGQALGFLIWNYFSDEEIIDAFLRLGDDKVPAVRYQIAHLMPSLYKQEKRDAFWAALNGMLQKENTHGVMLALLESVGRVCGSEPEKALDAVEVVLERDLPKTERTEASRALIEIPLVLYVVRDIERAHVVLKRFESDFARYSRELLDGVFLCSHYLTPREDYSGSVRERARSFLAELIDATKFRIAKLRHATSPQTEGTEALEVLDALATRIVFAFGLEQHGMTGTDVLALHERRQLYAELQPLLHRLVETDQSTLTSPMLPRTAYYLLQLMNAALQFDPVGVLAMAAAICRAGSVFHFEIDTSARDEAVKLVETALADHRDSLKQSAQSVGSLLDVFAKAGWSEAISLTFKLDEAFR